MKQYTNCHSLAKGLKKQVLYSIDQIPTLFINKYLYVAMNRLFNYLIINEEE